MKKLVFESKDFDWSCMSSAQACSKTAQAKFDEWFVREIMSAPMVYSLENTTESAWFRYSDNSPEKVDTHKARLVMIEEIKKDCKHQPIEISITNLGIGKSNCKNCGAVLVAEWKTK